MGEIMSESEEDSFLYFVDSEGLREGGAGRLEADCSDFFDESLRCSDSSAESLAVRGYSLFNYSYSFICGKC